MRQRRDTVTYKLPAAFVEANRAQLEAIDWRVTPVVTLDLGWLQNPVIEAVSGRSATIVRPATLKSANLIRRSVGQTVVDSDETALVIASRNPPPDQQD